MKADLMEVVCKCGDIDTINKYYSICTNNHQVIVQLMNCYRIDVGDDLIETKKDLDGLVIHLINLGVVGHLQWVFRHHSTYLMRHETFEKVLKALLECQHPKMSEYILSRRPDS